MEGNHALWEVIGGPLGSGGQSEVFLVRRPERMSARKKDIDQIHSYNPWGTSMAETRPTLTGEFADAVTDYARDERVLELGAMKVFSKLREAGAVGEQQAVNRLRQEIEVLGAGRDGLPKLLDFNLAERWMVTEYFPARSLEYNFSKYKGNVALAFRAFLSLVKTVAALHTDGIIHRDIKPANVFVREDDKLVLGDFGIVYLPNQPNRPTRAGESVGPHDYMPPWGEVDGRLAEVHHNFDIYMLGKLLWCMVSGRLRLQREYFDRPENDLTVLFKGDPAMYMVNVILKRCVVEREAQCRTSASDLVVIVSTYLGMLERGGQLLHVGIPRPCRVCGYGHYKSEGYASTQPPIPKEGPVGLRFWIGGSETATVPVFPFVCDTCGHLEFFTHAAPQLGAIDSVD
jgi:serine/threonine protein kinase